MTTDQFIDQVTQLLSRLFGVQLGSHGRQVALQALQNGLSPGQFVLTVIRNDSLNRL